MLFRIQTTTSVGARGKPVPFTTLSLQKINTADGSMKQYLEYGDFDKVDKYLRIIADR